MLRMFLLLGMLITACCPVAAADDCPDTALAEIQKGIDERNMPLLEKRVDFDALLDQGLDVFFAVLKNNAAALPPAFALMAGAGDSPQLRQTLRVFLKREIMKLLRYGVESGRFAGHPDASIPPAGPFSSLLDGVSTGSKTLRSSGPARVDGDRALLPAVLHDGGNEREYPLVLRLTRNNGLWRVTGLDNLSELTPRLCKEAAGRE